MLLKSLEIIARCIITGTNIDTIGALEDILPIYMAERHDYTPSKIGLVYMVLVILRFAIASTTVPLVSAVDQKTCSMGESYAQSYALVVVSDSIGTLISPNVVTVLVPRIGFSYVCLILVALLVASDVGVFIPPTIVQFRR
ncbi:hypothetical protein EV182_003473 [Spiromyces aspiralis]|uniref:Uncharacterized protein n=1 Tax=Spiromyces aspiralis TaxID=68401 RepID=A0ACC1HQ98_9FUNG|nr:hypothetical protein EV182_003473 [Spiromyces aspiralis]